MTLFLAVVAALIYGASIGMDKVFLEPLDDKVLARTLQKVALIVGLTFGGFFPVH